MFASTESLLATLVVVIITAISSWMQKRAQDREAATRNLRRGPQPPPRIRDQRSDANRPSRPVPHPAKETDWSAELRRLLDGDFNPHPLPPVLPEPVRTAEARTIIQARPTPVPRPAPPTHETTKELESARLVEASTAYKKAQHLQEDASSRLEKVVEQAKLRTVKEASAHHVLPSREISSALSLVRSPETTRQAFIASLIFGPPKALEN